MSAHSMAASDDDDDGGNISSSTVHINSKKVKIDAALVQQRLLVLLPKQYNHLQDYCNAQIALENAWQLSQQQSKSSDLMQAVVALQKATQRVQEDFQSLEAMVLALSPSSSLSPSPSTSTAIKEQVQSSSASNNSITNDKDNDTTSTRNHRQRRHVNDSATACSVDDCHQHHPFQFQWQERADEHLQRTRRILHNLQTPAGQTSSLGIPFPTASATKQEDTIVALATLRASVAQLQSVLEASKADNAV
jgi:hypothetical protein